MTQASLGLLFTDIEGSTRLLQDLGPDYGEVLLEHRRLLRAAFAAYDGTEEGTEGDAFFVTFPTATKAVAAALAGQLALAAHEWPPSGVVRVRMGVHVGDVNRVADTLVGMSVHEAARIAAVAHGGQVLASDAVVAAASTLPAECGWVDVGEHRLKDIASPMRLVQLSHPELRPDFPPPRSKAASRSNLPAQPTAFVGRRRELAEVRDLLRSARLVTVTGTGGVGKSRIATRVAADETGRFGDGVWMVDLAAVGEPEAVPGQFAAAVGLSDAATDDLAAALSERQMLLVVDNCEHVIAATTDVVSAVIQRCPSVTILATSREPLGVPGEVVWRVPPLDRADAVALLSQRAQAVNSRFAVTDDNRAAVDAVCDRLDAIPLALELAAARLTSLSIDQLATRLDQCFRLLAGGMRGVMERHRTLQATVDWSYELLDADEQDVLRRCGVFAGGFTLEAVEAVCPHLDPITVDDMVDRLVRKSLVVVDEPGGEVRFRLLETIRQYALDRLAHGGEIVDARDAHTAWVAGLTAAAGTTLWLGGDEASWLARLDLEDGNLRSALEWAVDRDDVHTAADMLIDVFGWLTARGRAAEGLDWTRRLVAARPSGSDVAMVDLLEMCFASNCGVSVDAVVARVRDSAAELAGSARPWLQPIAISYAAAWSYPSGDAAGARGAIAECERQLEAARPFGPGPTGWVLQPLLWVNLDAGDVAAAKACAEAGLAAAAEAGLSFMESRMAFNRARIAVAADDLDAAWTYAERAVAVARATGETFVVTAATLLLADVAAARDDYPTARDLAASIVDAVAESQPPEKLTEVLDRLEQYAALV